MADEANENKANISVDTSQERYHDTAHSPYGLSPGLEVDLPDVPERDRWMSRPTYILAMLGYAIGLGNLWRFPYLCYRWGGAVFLIPYLTSLILVGLPITLLETTLGQLVQRGDVGVFRGIHPRLAGVGLTSVIAIYMSGLYYKILIGWSVIYFYNSFKSPLPWSEDVVNACPMMAPATT